MRERTPDSPRLPRKSGDKQNQTPRTPRGLIGPRHVSYEKASTRTGGKKRPGRSLRPRLRERGSSRPNGPPGPEEIGDPSKKQEVAVAVPVPGDAGVGEEGKRRRRQSIIPCHFLCPGGNQGA